MRGTYPAEHNFGTPGGTNHVACQEAKGIEILEEDTKHYLTFTRGVQMADQQEEPTSSQSPEMAGSPIQSEGQGNRVTNEDLQSTMIQVLRSMKKISVET